MVFWRDYLDHLGQKDSLPSPTGLSYEIVTTHEECNEVRAHWRQHFGSPPHTPILDLPEEIIMNDLVLIVRDQNGIIAGSIWYHPMGTYNGKPVHLVDGFCIHPDWRKKGVGDYLLTELHRLTVDTPYTLFLKEGAPLSHAPFYTGHYVYRALQEGLKPFKSFIHAVTPRQARRLMAVYQEMDPSLILLRPSGITNQRWWRYHRGIHHVLICIQDTYQWKEGKKMGWITAWLESPGLTDSIREEAAWLLSDRAYPEFSYVWMDARWCSSEEWIPDGTFHWYAYRWDLCFRVKRSYAWVL